MVSFRKTQVFTPEEFSFYIQGLPSKFNKIIPEIEEEMAKSLALRIKRRAPLGSTGSLKRNITAEQNKKGWRITGPGHWSYVNAGVAPNKMIPVELFEAHTKKPGSTAGKSFKSLFGNQWPKAFVFAGYHDGKGFVDRSFVTFEKETPLIIERGINKALQK